MKNFIWSAIGIAILIHGYLFVKYGTADPCRAAVAHMVEERSPDAMMAGLALGVGARPPLSNCYLVAFRGGNMSDLGLPGPKTRPASQ